jgi:hypothetical protein
LRLRVFARVNFFLAKQERRKEIKEALSDLPAVGRLGLNLFFGAQRRRGAKKNPLCGLAALRANFFFSQRSNEIKSFASCLR